MILRKLDPINPHPPVTSIFLDPDGPIALVSRYKVVIYDILAPHTIPYNLLCLFVLSILYTSMKIFPICFTIHGIPDKFFAQSGNDKYYPSWKEQNV